MKELDWLFDNFVVEESVEYDMDSDDEGIGVKVKWLDSVTHDYIEIIDIEGIDKDTMSQIRQDLIKLLKYIRQALERKLSERPNEEV